MKPDRAKPLGSEERVLHIINDIYAAALDPGLWPEAIGRIVEAVGGSSGQLLSPTAQVLTQLWATHGFDPNVMVPYAGYYHELDLWTQELGALQLPSCTALTGEKMVQEVTFLRSEYFNDFLKPNDFQRIVTCFIDDGSSRNVPKTALSVYRPPGSKPFGEEDIQLLNVLSPHVRKAVQFHWRIADLEHRKATNAEILEHVAVGVILLDEAIRVTYMNPTARRIVSRNDGLALDHRELTAHLGAEAVELSRLLGQAARATMRLEALSSGEMSITRTNGKPPYRLIAVPVPGRDVFAVGRKHTAVIALVSEAQVPPKEAAEVAAYAYGLTPAEARLLRNLVEGKPLKSAADTLGIATNTAHTQLASIFRKTGTHRQIELLNLVLSMGSGDGR